MIRLKERTDKDAITITETIRIDFPIPGLRRVSESSNADVASAQTRPLHYWARFVRNGIPKLGTTHRIFDCGRNE